MERDGASTAAVILEDVSLFRIHVSKTQDRMRR